MRSIDFRAAGFSDSALNVNRPTDRVSWDDVFKAALTVGHRDQAALTQYGAQSWFEALTRFYRIRLALNDGPLDSIQFTDLFRGMDPSEKSGISYYVGLTFCKLYAERHLRIPWLMHHDVYRKFLESPLERGVRPDLVGLSVIGQWAVFEAKGGRRRPTEKSLARAQEQAGSLPRVQRQDVSWPVVSWTYITRAGVFVIWEDPPPQDDSGTKAALNVTPEDMLKDYYQPLLALQTITGANDTLVADARTSLFSGLRLSVRIERNLNHLIDEANYTQAYKFLCDRAKDLAGTPQASEGGLDGVTVSVR